MPVSQLILIPVVFNQLGKHWQHFIFLLFYFMSNFHASHSSVVMDCFGILPEFNLITWSAEPC